MKTVKSALIGAKQIASTDEMGILRELKAVLEKHRAIIIDHLLKDVSTYVIYKLGVKPTPNELQQLKQNLVDLQKSPANLLNYESICRAVMNRALVHLDNAPFYAEIDSVVKSVLEPVTSTEHESTSL